MSLTLSVSRPASGLLSSNSWKAITKDRWALQAVSGYIIPFVSPPRQWRPKIMRARSPAQTVLMRTAIQKLLDKRAVKQVNLVEGQFVSTLFLVEDRTVCKYRPIINLKLLNRFLEDWPFRSRPFLRLMILSAH